MVGWLFNGSSDVKGEVEVKEAFFENIASEEGGFHGGWLRIRNLEDFSILRTPYKAGNASHTSEMATKRYVPLRSGHADKPDLFLNCP